MLFFTFINGVIKMKKFIIITSIILTILFILLYIIIFYDYKTSEKTKKFMVSQYSDKNKTINTFCTDYYHLGKVYIENGIEHSETLNLRRVDKNKWTGKYYKSTNEVGIEREIVYENEKYYDSKTGKEIKDFIPYFQSDIIKYDELETTEEVSMGIISDYTPNEGYFRGKYLDKKSFKEFFKNSDWNLEGDLKMDVYYQSKWTLYYQMEIKTENEKLHLWESCRYIK